MNDDRHVLIKRYDINPLMIKLLMSLIIQVKMN